MTIKDIFFNIKKKRCSSNSLIIMMVATIEGVSFYLEILPLFYIKCRFKT